MISKFRKRRVHSQSPFSLLAVGRVALSWHRCHFVEWFRFLYRVCLLCCVHCMRFRALTRCSVFTAVRRKGDRVNCLAITQAQESCLLVCIRLTQFDVNVVINDDGNAFICHLQRFIVQLQRWNLSPRVRWFYLSLYIWVSKLGLWGCGVYCNKMQDYYFLLEKQQQPKLIPMIGSKQSTDL